jgi:hypothetical protein
MLVGPIHGTVRPWFQCSGPQHWSQTDKALNMDFLLAFVSSPAAFRRTASDTSEIGSNRRRADRPEANHPPPLGNAA